MQIQQAPRLPRAFPTEKKSEAPPPPQNTPPEPGILSLAGERLIDLSYTAGALPKFIYPTVTGTPEQQALVWQALDNLPMHHAVRPVSIEVLPSLPKGPNLLGVNRTGVGAIQINAGGYGMTNPSEFRYTVTHEVGHSVDYRSGMFSAFSRQHPSANNPIYGKGPFVSDYAATQPPEDFAETYGEHHTRPHALRYINSAKADHQTQLDQPTYLEKLVDRPAFRETGKFVAAQFQAAPIARMGLEIARQAMVMNLAIHGTGEFVEGVSKGNGSRAVAGLLAAGAGVGLAMAPSVPMAGLYASAALGANRGLNEARMAGASPERKALATVAGAIGGTVGGFVAPLALVQAGYSLAGPIGGTVGLVVGGTMGSWLGSKWAAQAALGATS